jgi:hypothetical protein
LQQRIADLIDENGRQGHCGDGGPDSAADPSSYRARACKGHGSTDVAGDIVLVIN